ncbi:MAG: hypothetical protein FWE22_04470 [Firmicutes bacterium]|nr:hypothetical protein [Bacillota bacterium]
MKKRIFLTSLIIVLVALSAMFLIACPNDNGNGNGNGNKYEYDETVYLEVPANLTLNVQTQIATWNTVENATYFTIRVGAVETIVRTTSFDINTLRLTPGNHAVVVRANGRIEDRIRFVESDFSAVGGHVNIPEPIGTRLYTQADLNQLNNSFGSFVLGSDIVLSGAHVPIENFTGTLNGANRSLSGLTISGNVRYIGLFGVVRNSMVVQNLNLRDFNFNLTTPGTVFAGALISQIELSESRDVSIVIDNVFANDLTINAASSTSDVYAGGLIGASSTNLFLDNVSPINITNSKVYDSTITATSTAIGSNAFAGGIIGYAYIQTPFALLNRHSALTVENSEVDAVIRAYAAVAAMSGGIIGFFQAHNNQHAFYHMGQARRRPAELGVLNFLMIDSVVARGVVHANARSAYAGGISGKMFLYFDTNSEFRNLTNYALVSATTTTTAPAIGSSHSHALSFIGQFDDTTIITIQNFSNNTANLNNYTIIFFD